MKSKVEYTTDALFVKKDKEPLWFCETKYNMPGQVYPERYRV